MIKIKQKLLAKYNIADAQLNNTIEIDRQTGRLRRYDEIYNKLSNENEHKFYRSFNNTQHSPTQIPTKDDIKHFWTTILSNPVTYNKDNTTTEHKINTDFNQAVIKIRINKIKTKP